MSFTCPQCLAPASLEITHSIELPPDSRSDEITLQVVECLLCGFQGLAVYEESRRSLLETDRWDHTGYHVDKEIIERVNTMIQKCPDPHNARCRCTAHQELGKQEPSGRWQGLFGVQSSSSFKLILAGIPEE